MYRKAIKKILPASGSDAKSDGTEADVDQATPKAPANKGGRKREDANEGGSPSPKKPRIPGAKPVKKSENSETHIAGKEDDSSMAPSSCILQLTFWGRSRRGGRHQDGEDD